MAPPSTPTLRTPSPPWGVCCSSAWLPVRPRRWRWQSWLPQPRARRSSPWGASALEQSNLVVTRFLLASGVGDPPDGVPVIPHPPAVPAGRPIRGAGRLRSDRDHARRPGTSGRRRKGRKVSGLVHPCVDRGSLVIVKAGSALARVLRAAPVKDPWRAGSPPGPRRGESRRHPLCSAWRWEIAGRPARCTRPISCQPGQRLSGTADFKVTDVTLADPAQPAVFAIVGGIRGYFVLERAGGSFVIVRAGAD